METGYRNEHLDVVHYGSFPSVNPSVKLKTGQSKNEFHEESALGIACTHGKYDKVKLLIEQGSDINKKDPANFTPIMRAVASGHRKIIELLVSNGAKISYDLLCSVQTKIELLKESAKMGAEEPYAVAIWKNFLDYLIDVGKKQ